MIRDSQAAMLSQRQRGSSAVRLTVPPQVAAAESGSSPSPPSTASESESSSRGPSTSRSQPPTFTRARSRSGTLTRHSKTSSNRLRAFSVGMAFNPNLSISRADTGDSPSNGMARAGPSDLGSPPPYTPEPDSNSPFLTKRAMSSPHLHSPPQAPTALHPYPHSQAGSRRPSSSALHAHVHGHLHEHSYARHRTAYARAEIDEDEDVSESTASADEGLTYKPQEPSLAGTLRERLFGKGKGRADGAVRVKPITTTPGVPGAGETETEGDSDSSRRLPTARLTESSSLSALSPLSTSMSIPILSPHSQKPSFLSLAPLLFEFSRLLSIVPACYGTFWNLYHVVRPPNNSWGWGAEHAVSMLWAVLTGWQCLQLTTGLLKRWRVYYSPLPTLIRLLGLQAICWPAAQATLTVLNSEVRPLICWAVIGTTTCCSRSVQMWVTSNIVEPPTPSPDGALKRRSRRKWDWGAVTRECILPAAAVYFIMAWMAVLRHEWEAC